MNAEDIVAVNQLLALYGHVADAAKFQPVESPAQRRLADVFTEDAEFDATAVGSGLWRGIEEIRTLFARPKPAHPRSHQTSNVYVYRDVGEVRVISKWHVVTWSGKVVVGSYHDVVVRVPGGWRIKGRVAVF